MDLGIACQSGGGNMLGSVSVYVPCYKYGHFLQECVESILEQERVDVRILILDDASPDDTPEVAAELVRRDARVEYRRHETNQGHIATYNEGIAWATSKYTMLLSADDLLAPGALARAAELMDAHPEVGFVYGRVVSFETKPLPVAPHSEPGPLGWKVIEGSEWLKQQCASGINRILSPEAIVRTDLLHRTGGYLVELPHTGDLEMWLRLAAHASVGYIDADQAFYRYHQNNMHKSLAAGFHSQLVHHKAAYDSFFRRYADRLNSAEILRRTSCGVLAQEALDRSYKAFLEGDLRTCRNLVHFAESADPGVMGTRFHSRMKWKIRIGPRSWSYLRRLLRRDPTMTVMQGVDRR